VGEPAAARLEVAATTPCASIHLVIRVGIFHFFLDPEC